MDIFLFCLMLSCWEKACSGGGDIDEYKSIFKYGSRGLARNSDSSLAQIEASAKDLVKPFASLKYSKLKKNPRKVNSIRVAAKYMPNQLSHPDINGLQPNSLSTEMGKYLVKVSSALHSKQPEEFIVKDSEIVPGSKFYHAIEILPKNEASGIPRNELEDKFLEETAGTDLPTKSVRDLLIVSENVETSQHNSESDDTNLEGSQTSSLIRSNEESVFSDEFQSSGEEMKDFEKDIDGEKSGRLLGILFENDTASSCITPKNETGRCRRFRHCLLSNILSNFNDFLQYVCLIRGALVGICCPDNPVIEIINPEANTTESDTEMDLKQPPEGCGLNTKTRIVGGTISVPHEWSWMVALMRRNRFYCGGVIINNWYILTAAHCVLGIDVKDLTVRLGEYNFSEQKEHQEDLSVAEIKRHSQFVTLTFQHDIALLKLKRRIRYTKFVGSICLPTQTSRNYSDVNGTVVGWGTVSFGGAASPILRQVTVPVWKNEDCDRTYLLEAIGNSFLCAGNPEKGEDACQGDSGGPLMTLTDKGRWEVIGIVSWGRRCGDPTYPGVYTRITTYLEWITRNMI